MIRCGHRPHFTTPVWRQSLLAACHGDSTLRAARTRVYARSVSGTISAAPLLGKTSFATETSYGGYTRGDVPESATPVGGFPSGHSPDGVWDVTGNVWEWTVCRFRENAEDWRQDDTSCHQDDIVCHFDDSECHQDDKSGDRVTPPAGLKSLSAAPRVVRGRSWFDNPQSLRAAYRGGLDPGYRLDYLGFRVVCRGSRQHIDP